MVANVRRQPCKFSLLRWVNCLFSNAIGGLTRLLPAAAHVIVKARLNSLSGRVWWSVVPLVSLSDERAFNRQEDS
jgi:hypothetical protein